MVVLDFCTFAKFIVSFVFSMYCFVLLSSVLKCSKFIFSERSVLVVCVREAILYIIIWV